MSHKRDRLLRDIFSDPVSANIHWREVESLLGHLGAEFLSVHGALLHLRLNGVETTLHRPHHRGTCSKQDIRHLRDFLESASAGPASQKPVGDGR